MKRKILAIICVALASIITFSLFKVSAKAENAPLDDIEVNSKAHLLIDFDSGTEICSKNKLERLQIASMVKIMTLNIIFDNIEQGNLSLTDDITISENASSMGGSQAFLDPNCSYKAEELIKSIIVASANDSCVAMAEHIAGSVESFVCQMNEKAERLGMENTNFVNCTGLPAPNAYSCAEDVARMSKELMKRELFYNYSKVWMYDLVHPSGRTTTLTNTNKLSRFYEGCDGGKTGYTTEAKSCLSATAKRGDTRLLCVVIGAPSSKERNSEVTKLFNHGFANYESKVVLNCGELSDKVVVKNGKVDKIPVSVAEKTVVFCNKKNCSKNIEVKYEYNDLCAPIAKGQQIGYAVICVDGIEYCRVNLLSNEKVEPNEYVDFVKDIMKSW